MRRSICLSAVVKQFSVTPQFRSHAPYARCMFLPSVAAVQIVKCGSYDTLSGESRETVTLRNHATLF